jgi:hypothetical protein
LFLKDNPVLQAEIEEKVKVVLGIRPLAGTPEPETADEEVESIVRLPVKSWGRRVVSLRKLEPGTPLFSVSFPSASSRRVVRGA